MCVIILVTFVALVELLVFANFVGKMCVNKSDVTNC